MKQSTDDGLAVALISMTQFIEPIDNTLQTFQDDCLVFRIRTAFRYPRPKRVCDNNHAGENEYQK
jgi:hypothetical protein